MRVKLVGDGCSVCNPDYRREMKPGPFGRLCELLDMTRIEVLGRTWPKPRMDLKFHCTLLTALDYHIIAAVILDWPEEAYENYDRSLNL